MKIFTVLLLALPVTASELPSFPGAEGFGATTPGGRGGKVLIVSNLNDSGRGSLRAALEAEGPRIVVFRVSGLIDLQSPIRVREPFVTVAGQTAPGDGICLRRFGLSIDTHDVVVRHLRSRPGDVSGTEVDGLAVGGTSRNVVVDHCSVSWSVDENLSPSGGISDITVQWCIIAEGLNRGVHSKGAHGYGSLVRASGGLTMHHNLWAHNQSRNPRLGDNYGRPPFPRFDVRNNVIYDAGGASIAGDSFEANYVGNYLKNGPETPPNSAIFAPTERAALRFFLSGNHPAGMRPFARPGAETVQTAFPAPPVKTDSPLEAFRRVLAEAGASQPKRDAVDARIVADVLNGTGAHIDSQWEAGGWPEYRSARPPRDTDRDGMPDEWETARGLDPRNAADAARDRNGDGYTNIEEYLNELAARVRPSASSRPR